MKTERPDEWAEVVAFDRAVRERSGAFGRAELLGRAYLHRSLAPLSEVDLTDERDHGQLDMFGEECEGMCGL